MGRSKYRVRWNLHTLDSTGRQTSAPEHREAGPFDNRPTAERFAAGLAETCGPRLGNVTIDDCGETATTKEA